MALSEADVTKQLQQMINFIKKEAEEKASEIRVKTDAEFNIEKQNIIQAEKKKINAEFERKTKAIEVKRKIAYSNELNQSRLKTLKAREDAVHGMCSEAASRLGSISAQQSTYKTLLEQLIIQGLLKLGEDEVTVIGRAVDEQLLQSVIGNAASAYKDKTGKQVAVSVSKQHHLAPQSPGGILLSAKEGRILCNNTLEQRLKLAYEGLLPEIRIILFGRSESRKFTS